MFPMWHFVLIAITPVNNCTVKRKWIAANELWTVLLSYLETDFDRNRIPCFQIHTWMLKYIALISVHGRSIVFPCPVPGFLLRKLQRMTFRSPITCLEWQHPDLLCEMLDDWQFSSPCYPQWQLKAASSRQEYFGRCRTCWGLRWISD